MPRQTEPKFDYWRDTWEPMTRAHYATGGWYELNGRRLTVDEAVAPHPGDVTIHRADEPVVFRGARWYAYLKAFKPSSYTHKCA